MRVNEKSFGTIGATWSRGAIRFTYAHTEHSNKLVTQLIGLDKTSWDILTTMKS